MLRALTTSGESTLAWHAVRGDGYCCPACGEPVVLKHGSIVTPHFAHRPDSACAYGVGESERHMAMKRQLGEFFSSFNRGAVEYEAPVAPGHRADVVVYPSDLQPWAFVVECQASALACETFSRRTVDYNAAGYPLLWVWDSTRLGLKPEYTFGDRGRLEPRFEPRIPSEIRLCHDEAGGSAYVLDREGIVRAAHLEEVEERWNEYQEEWYVPKTKRRAVFTATWLEPAPFEGESGQQFVQLGEPTWWKPSTDPRVSRPLAERKQPPADGFWKPGRLGIR